MNSAFFSILIPVYNVKNFLCECLDSIVNQTYTDIEIIIVDDGSTDNSGKICDEYARKDNRIQVIHKENNGLISARREGLKAANGRYIWFVDSDDITERTALEKIHRVISESGAEIVFFDYKRIDNSGREYGRISHNDFAEGFVDITSYRTAFLTNTGLVSLWQKVFLNDLFDKDADYSSLYWISKGEDIIQSLPLLDNVEKIYYLPECFYYYRANFSSILHTFNFGRFDEDEYCQKKRIEYLKKWELDTDKNISECYLCYLAVIIGELRMFFCSQNAKNRENLLNVRKNTVINKLEKYQNNKMIPLYMRLYLKLFFNNNFKALRIYSFFYNYMANLKNSIKYKVKELIR